MDNIANLAIKFDENGICNYYYEYYKQMPKQISREEALAALEKPIYAEQQLATDKSFVLKKLGLTPEIFDNYIENSIVQHELFDAYDKHVNRNKVLFTLKKYSVK